MDNLKVRMYLFTGFLESGKSTFIQDTIVNTNFCDGEETVLISCEDGEFQYNVNDLKAHHTTLIQIEELSDLNIDFYNNILDKYNPTQVLIEYNGMWNTDDLFKIERPSGWEFVQILTTINASTFQFFVNNTNMRSLLFQHTSKSDIIIFNRLPEGAKKAPLRNNIKAINPQAQIIYEKEDGTIDNSVEEDLPFDYNAPSLDIEDHNFGIFCYDAMEHPERYNNKHLRLKGKFIGKDRVQEGGFVLGRYAMVCCEEDTSLIGLICISEEYRDKLLPDEWIVVEGTTHLNYDEEYGQNIVVLDVEKLEGCKPLQYEYVTFD